MPRIIITKKQVIATPLMNCCYQYDNTWNRQHIGLRFIHFAISIANTMLKCIKSCVAESEIQQVMTFISLELPEYDRNCNHNN